MSASSWPDRDLDTLLQISFGSILTPVGLGMLVYGFGGFFNLLPGGDISSLLLIYGFVISLLGFALSYAQLKPVPCKTTAEAFALRDSQCTDIQKQVRWSEVSRQLLSQQPPYPSRNARTSSKIRRGMQTVVDSLPLHCRCFCSLTTLTLAKQLPLPDPDPDSGLVLNLTQTLTLAWFCT